MELIMELEVYHYDEHDEERINSKILVKEVVSGKQSLSALSVSRFEKDAGPINEPIDEVEFLMQRIGYES
jgi:hypothetical protein